MRWLPVLVLSLFALTAWSVIETYQFETEKQRERYHHLVEELRCPKCQNQSLASSDAPIAADLREQLHRLIVSGHSDEEIRNFMLDRYGDFVLYRPRLNAQTLILWIAPVLLLLTGALLWWLQLRRRSHSASDTAAPLSEEEHRRVERLLSEDRDD